MAEDEDNNKETSNIRSSPYSSPMYNYGSGIVLLTNPNTEIRELELNYRCAVLDEDNKLKYYGKPLMNDIGIKSVIGQVQAIVNKMTVMNGFEKGEIISLVDYLGDTLAKDLMMNRLNYEIVSETARDRIYFAALTTSYITLKRAFNEGDRRFWKGSQQEIKQIVETQQKRKGLFDFFKKQ